MNSLFRIITLFSLILTFSGVTRQLPTQLAREEHPEDAWMQSRLYPDHTFDAKAYDKALQAERLALQLRGPATAGFDNEWRLEGPGNIGARVNTIAVNPLNENIIYAGYSRGGVFKTENGGNTWLPIFDGQNNLNIGNIALNPSNPNEVFVGTGDVNIGGYYSVGNGIWKSPDGGQTWQSLGLEQTRVVSRIIVHPTDANVIYAGTMGAPYEKNNNRGLYKSTDGGQTWSQSLFVSDSSGIIDLVMDPFDPNTLYASSWNRMRTNKVNFVSGPDAKIFKTTDGGSTWTALTQGLPTDVMGRIGLAISAQTPGLVFASYTDTDSQLYDVYKSTNGGSSWTAMNTWATNFDTGILGGFGWYFGQLRVNPQDDSDVFVLGVGMQRTLDSGGDWFNAIDWQISDVHADKHDLVFTPAGNMLLGTDGGIYKSSDQGSSWVKIENIAATQFYRVAYNPHSPDMYYGGAQDNGTLVGDYTSVNSWQRIYGGDGFQARFHPTDPNIFFVEYQNGALNATTDGGQSFNDATLGIDGADRKHWDFPYIISAHNAERMFCGTQRMYQNNSGAWADWFPISDDLTDGLVYFSSAHTISSVAESPLNENYIYAGTTDGNVWRSTNQGGSWEAIHQNGLPDRYISAVNASPDNEGHIFVTQTGYRDGDYVPHVFRSDNNGNTWVDISSNLPQVAVNDLFVLPGYDDQLLFVATDIGAYGSIDGGISWERLGTNMPFVPIFDIEFNVSQSRLIAATFARSIQSYDISELLQVVENKDITPSLTIGVSPNPVCDILQITLPEQSGATIRVFDIQGRQVAQKQWSPASSEISVAELAAGTYVIQAQLPKRKYLSQAFVVQR